MFGRLLAADEAPEVTSFEPPFLNSQSWRHIVAVDTVSSGQAPVQFLEFTPLNSEESNSSAPQTSSSASSIIIATPHAPIKRVRRTK